MLLGAYAIRPSRRQANASKTKPGCPQAAIEVELKAWRAATAKAAKPLVDSAVASFAAHTAFITATLDLLKDVADHSNLTLDPEVVTFH